MTENVVTLLQRHPFVEEFQPQHIDKLASMATRVRFERDQVIFREGDECGEFYLIMTGLVALEIAAPDHTLRVQTLSAGDELGWSAILMGRRKHFQARALERAEALAFDGGELLAACKQDAAFGYRADAPAAGRGVRAAAGDAAPGAGHVLAGGQARRSVTGASCSTLEREATDEIAIGLRLSLACPLPAAPTPCSTTPPRKR